MDAALKTTQGRSKYMQQSFLSVQQSGLAYTTLCGGRVYALACDTNGIGRLAVVQGSRMIVGAMRRLEGVVASLDSCLPQHVIYIPHS